MNITWQKSYYNKSSGGYIMKLNDKIVRSISMIFTFLIFILIVICDYLEVALLTRNIILSLPIMSFLIFNLIYLLKNKRISKLQFKFSIISNIAVLLLWIFYVLYTQLM